MAVKFLCLLLLVPFICFGKEIKYELKSPNGAVLLSLSIDKDITLRTSKNGEQLLYPSVISLSVQNMMNTFVVSSAKTKSINEVIVPAIKTKFAIIKNEANEITIQFKTGLSLTLRAYNNGVAYRWSFLKKGSYKILDEQFDIKINTEAPVFFPMEKSMFSHNENRYLNVPVKNLADALGSMPLLINGSKTKLLFTESDLLDYVSMFIKGTGTGFKAVFPHYPLEEKTMNDRDVMVNKEEEYIAVVTAPATLPWRIMMIEDNAAGLLTNQLVYQLATPATGDFSWVKPGKVCWDWWNANNIYKVDFKAGVNTVTYKYYIDFAAENKVPYIILDEGWYVLGNVTEIVKDINLQELIVYGKQKNVDIILWVTWKGLNDKMTEALDLYKSWGVAGIKVDFMQRNDQKMVQFYLKATQETAKRQLLIDFHGCYKPTGLERTYPNALTREGVYGLENSKWDSTTRTIGPTHNVTLPFTRMVAGPMDYTPGSMMNYQASDWHAVFNNPTSQGTRCQQMAMYVIYESPLQMMADNPTNYKANQECTDFIASVPVEWYDTKVLDAEAGQHLAMARKAKNGDWYIGAMNDWTERTMQLNLSFLEMGNYNIEIFQDGINANNVAMDYKKIMQTVNNKSILDITLAKGGGWAARINKLP
jgi:alpha-glucosidase